MAILPYPNPMKILLLLLATCGAVACAVPVPAGSPAEPRTELQPPAGDSSPATAPPLDLSGVWATGSVGEPAAPRIVVHLQCNHTPPFWIIDQRGDTVRAWTNPASHAQGMRAPDPVRPIPAEGRLIGVRVTMSGGGSRYVLRYDSTTGHLRGTLNGGPFWAVREEIVSAQGCIAIP
jgi:hypothetical protein